ncbi:MAG: hypothetical protein KAU21_10060, partial [Gammaproteobacteria bacterium]|nr:hypothetical protein [Gammaproteobacteria bacterium]
MATTKTNKLPSLRSRYLILASFVTVLLLTGAAIASWYINDVSDKNSYALATNKSVTTTVNDLTAALTRVTSIITTMLVQPETGHEALIRLDLEKSQSLISSLHANSKIISTDLDKSINRLSGLIDVLSKKINYLIKQRKSADWVYPILPFISSKLLVPNRNFISATELAINEYITDDLPLNDTYNQLHELRNLW